MLTRQGGVQLNPDLTFLNEVSRLYEQYVAMWNSAPENLEALGGGFNVTLGALHPVLRCHIFRFQSRPPIRGRPLRLNKNCLLRPSSTLADQESLSDKFPQGSEFI